MKKGMKVEESKKLSNLLGKEISKISITKHRTLLQCERLLGIDTDRNLLR
jgi:hypothetical protein